MNKCNACGRNTKLEFHTLCSECYNLYRSVAPQVNFNKANIPDLAERFLITESLKAKQKPKPIPRITSGTLFISARPKKMCYVYVLFNGVDAVKIGKSKKPFARKKELQTGSPHKLELIGQIVGDEELEHTIHRALESQRMSGEWFKFNDETKAVLKSLSIL
jgi:hypothetical protein